MISIIPVTGIPIIKDENQLWQSLKDSLQNLIEENDVLVCAHTPFSRVMGYKFHIDSVEPSQKAKELAKELDKDPKKIEIILQASDDIVKHGRNVLITENKAGIICANAGVDSSNAGIGYVVTIPEDPDALARKIADFVKLELGKEIVVIISDTVGRALRRGAINIGIGVAGIEPMKSEIGKKDLFGYEMKVSEIAIADELASAAELYQGQTNEGTPYVIIRGYKYNKSENVSAKILNRPSEERLFK